MIKKLLFIFVLACSFRLSAQCPPEGTVNVNTQAALEQLMAQYPDCTQLDYLIIGQYDGDPAKAVNSLLPLHNITAVTGFVLVPDTCQCTSLAGLENLTSIGTELYIYGNNISDISALQNLTSVGGTLYIGGAPLSSLAPLNNLTTLGGLYYDEENNVLQEFMVLNNTNFEGDITLRFSNDHDISGLNSLQTVSGQLWIEGPITDISPLASITSVGELYLHTANSNLEALSSLSNVDRALSLWCANASSFEPLGNLTHTGTLSLIEMPLVTSLHGFEGLTAIQGDASPFGPGSIAINNLDSLTNLDGLQNITTLHGGNFYFVNNANLTEISALSNIDPQSILSATFVGNPSLATCAYPNICSYLQGTGIVDISGNAPGCATEEQVLAACAVSGVDDVQVAELLAYPNPVKDMLYLTSTQPVTEVRVYNNLGQKVTDIKGSNITQLNLYELSNGLYFCHTADASGKKEVLKFMVVK